MRTESSAPALLYGMQYRRSDFDVTNAVQVSSAEAVRRAVGDLFRQAWPNYPLDRLDSAFQDFERLFNGQFPGYYGCDTVYHDLQHSLDGTLAVARLIVAHDRTCPIDERMGPERAVLGVVTALFHDAGYIRQTDDQTHRNGAEFTRSHVSRSAHFIGRYLPTIGMAAWVPVATKIVHFTGYEVQFDQIRLDDHRDRRLGHLIGTGDLIAQMADRCYLEKCRDRLYPEFVLGGIAMPSDEAGKPSVRFSSGLDVLRQTPDFAQEVRHTRLDGEFGGLYRTLEALFNGRNPYMEMIDRNLDYLAEILRTGRWPMLRREPPCFTWERNPVQNIRSLVIGHLKQVWK
ncbi:hypothetical protein [Steroidobacter denitrificans]|uniref:hypothetical protein n=1 Tax=Steroidobacter denitrificans TaxID=465721 RepID=UPI001AEFE7C1|nr:hypothetical protein [Steroidobacter denitrificans]